MRSAALGLMVLLGACGQAETQPDLVTVNLPGSTDAPAPPPAPSPAPARAFQALGTEPFWSATVARGKLTWSTPEAMPGITVEAAGGAEGRGWRYTATLQGEPLELAIEQGTCSDGMSDTVYAYTARVTLGPRRLVGCARAPSGQR